MITPQQVQEKYDAAEIAATKEVRDYWIEWFKKEGLPITVPLNVKWQNAFDSACNGYLLRMVVIPSRFQGVKITVENSQSSPYLWRQLRVKSARGFDKFIANLHSNAF